MDELEDQRRLIDTTVSKAFGVVRSRLGVQLEESHALKRELEKQSEELLRLQQRLSNFDAVQRENEQLRKELGDLRRQHASATPQREYDELEHERDALIRDNQLKQKTIDSLRAMINYEKTKSKDWWHHSRASPSSPSRRESSLQQRNEVATARHTSSVLGDIPAMSNQALLQKLVSPLKETLTDAKSSAPLAQTGTEMQPSSFSVKGFVDEDVLPPLLATGKTEDLGGPTSFPGSDDTCSHGDSSSELLPTTSPPLPSSPSVRRSDESNLLHERSDQSTTEYFSSDSTAPPSQPCLNQECNQEKLRDDLSLESLEVVSARPVGRKSGKYNVSTPSAKLARGLAGNAEEPVTLKSEPEESFQTAADNTSGLTSTCNENLGRTAFNSPKRTQSPQILPAHGASSVLQIAEDEDIVPDNNDFDRQPAKSLSARRNEDLRPSSDLSRPRPLQEIKNYERVLPRTTKSPQPPTKKRRSNDSQEAAAIRIVAEEGEDHNRSRKKSPGKLASLASPARSNTSAYRRLGNLLEGPSPAKPVLTKPSPRTTNLMDGHLLSAAASTNSTMKDQLDNMRLTNDKSWEWYDSAEALLHSVDSQSPVLPEKKPPSTPLDSHKTPKAQHEPHRSSLPRKRRPQDGPEDEEPFRSRPLHQLELGHFKVNPKANAGFDYAYTDVIRSRDQRKCLPGCTRPECCGSKFRALAGTLPKLAANETRFLEPDPSEDASSQQSDNDLLLNFLGPGSEERIQTLTSVARENLLLEAKTKIAADRYGKMHRHAHERPNSPPGFWRTEMPDTQEEIANRLDAKKREREEVERRYREALKEEGRWMFADE
jgi:hypothetical protein